MSTKKAEGSSRQQLLLVGIIAFLVGGITGYMIRANTSSPIPPVQETLQSQPNNALQSKPKNQSIQGNLVFNADPEKYKDLLVNVWEIKDGKLVGAVDWNFILNQQQGTTYSYHFSRLDPSKTYGVEFVGHRKDNREDKFTVTKCSGSTTIFPDMCVINFPGTGTADFSSN